MKLKDEGVELLDDEVWMETGDGAIPISQYWPFDIKLAVRLFHTEFDYGKIHYRVAYDPQDSNEEGPNFRCDRVHEMSMVTHPTRGALMVGTSYPDEREHPQQALDREYQRLTGELGLLMDGLMSPVPPNESPHPYWSELDIAIGPAILVFGQSGPEVYEDSAPECLVDVGNWDDVPGQLGELMDRYEAQSEDAFGDYGSHFMSAVHSCNGFRGSYMDNVAALQGFNAIASWLWTPEANLDDEPNGG